MIVVAVPLVALIAVSVASLMVQTSERHQRSTIVAAFRLSSAASQVLSSSAQLSQEANQLSREVDDFLAGVKAA